MKTRTSLAHSELRKGSTLLLNLVALGVVGIFVYGIMGKAKSVGDEIKASRQKAKEAQALADRYRKPLAANTE